MNIYYKRENTFCKWPFQDEIDERYVVFSTDKKGRKEICRLDPQLSDKDRKKEVRKRIHELGLHPKNINLIRR